jgi:hypothetical protein
MRRRRIPGGTARDRRRDVGGRARPVERTSPAPQTAQVAAAWLDQAVHLVLARREMSRDLAVAYYRLARALRTGTTIPDPYNPIPTSVTMEELRFEFKRAVGGPRRRPVSPADGSTSPAPTPTTPQRSQADSGGIQAVRAWGHRPHRAHRRISNSSKGSRRLCGRGSPNRPGGARACPRDQAESEDRHQPAGHQVDAAAQGRP